MNEREVVQAALDRANYILGLLETQAAGYTVLTIPVPLQLELEEKRKEVNSLAARLAQMEGRGRVPDNLPGRAPIFVGRQEELARCLEVLAPEGREWVVVIDGQGGIGKTALALEAAHQAREYAWFDAYCFVSAKTTWLSPEGVRQETLALTSLNAFVRETARLLDCAAANQTSDPAERRWLLLDELRGRRALLIWDNLETLTQTERDQISEFLRRLPGANKAILTSRRHTGESALTLRLDSLAEQESFLLMEALARRAPRVAAELQAAGMAGRRALHDAAGGNPLVLQYALGFVADKGLSVAQAAARVREADRAGNLYRFLFADAAQALPATDQAILSALTGFATPVEVSTLAGIVNCTIREAETAVERLVISSLVNAVGGGRYGLHPLTRTFVRAALDGESFPGVPTLGLDPAARRAALQYWVAYAEKYGGWSTGSYQTFAQLEAEWANLEAAAGELWALTGLPNQLREAEAARLLTALSRDLMRFLMFRGYWDERLRLAEWAYIASEAVSDTLAAGWAAYNMATLHYNRAETDLAATWAARMTAAMKQAADPRGQAYALRQQGLVARQQGALVAAEHDFLAALAQYETLDDQGGIAIVLNDLGRLWLMQRQYDRAEEYYRRALAIDEQRHHWEGVANRSGNLGLVALERGQFQAARPWFEQALSLAREIGREDLVADMLYGLARVLEATGDCAAALPLAEECLRIRARLRHRNLGPAHELVLRLSQHN